ncbi:MAG: potassium-transporting ATPase subunit KdpA [Finegoldia magna]|uniref:Potassium-transporting ATPase potassium-binding subunit n=2 Tax=Finegoldia magna TaxID=1260 RepID=D6SBG1_FINMA|nr:potassium-transporting ATPase subunit KdpA [Finegoldia magna]EFH92811.1 K+-transporting ATPase, A subunit [Finegoldia magna ATCC 53516]MBS5942222.1 potassium-transporting ATPase subunit KdpA [Finegoldia magna]MDU1011115.1 potassium-transporting ATPase subunit KdpA [Finegoldia magna]MDU1086781.1 potassium-transporting ATPase subunit KdpA [Finegoldia magna]MDU3192513.1 potassium-transporting ATPase subunit KdpA [Finegoldia magna]
MFQILITLLIFLIIIFPIGNYLYKITVNKQTCLDSIFDRFDSLIFKVLKIDKNDMDWKQYAKTLLLVNACLVFVGYLVLRVQSFNLFNPNKIQAMEESLSFNTIISFMTNTNLQHYSGESGLSYFSQMFVITMMMFTSAATGYAACVAMIRGILGKKMGNFYVDFIKIITRFLLPASIIVGIILVSQGVPQNLNSNMIVSTIEGKNQQIASGPVAALESIKHLGTNGGGFFGANSSTPFENPNIISNIIELLSMMILPASCIFIFGKMAYDNSKEKSTNNDDHKSIKSINRKHILIGTEGRTVFVAMSILFLIGLGICYFTESHGINGATLSGISQNLGNMEGKEMRFGISQSTLFTTVTTSFTTGTVNNMHDTLTPLGGMVPLINMMMNVVFGGAGVGLMNMLIYAILAVFICGLMIGKTPEYLGKKIEGNEMKLAALSIIIHPLLILGFSALAVSVNGGVQGITNPGFHGLSQVLYEFSSSAANNGSGFEGLSDNNLFWNITCGLVMFLGRYLSIIIQLAIAGSLSKKVNVNETIGTLKTDNLTFSIIIVIVVYIFSALTFLPVLALGPIAEWLTL